MEFPEIKKELLRLNWSESAFKCESIDELILDIKANIDWYLEKGVTAKNLKKWFSEKELRKRGICVGGNKSLMTSINTTIVVLGDGVFNVTSLMDCEVVVKVYDQGSVIIKAYNASKVAITAKDSSSVTLIMYRDTNASVEMQDNSTIEVAMLNSSCAKINGNDSSKIVALMRDNSSATIKTYQESKSTIKTHDNAQAIEQNL